MYLKQHNSTSLISNCNNWINIYSVWPIISACSLRHFYFMSVYFISAGWFRIALIFPVPTITGILTEIYNQNQTQENATGVYDFVMYCACTALCQTIWADIIFNQNTHCINVNVKIENQSNQVITWLSQKFCCVLWLDFGNPRGEIDIW